MYVGLFIFVTLVVILFSFSHKDSYLQREYRKYAVSQATPWLPRPLLDDDNVLRYGRLPHLQRLVS